MEAGQLCLRRGEEKKLLAGQQWIFDNEADWVDERCRDGEVIEVLDSRLRFVGKGFYNSRSRIVVRMLTLRREETIDRDFFRRRLLAAWENRRKLGFSDACRVVFGEADGLPGLTVDKFSDCLSFQIVCLGMERRKLELIELLGELFHPTCIYERNDLAVREKEGLPQQKGCVCGAVPKELVIREHDALMAVDLENGQKTGHFLDQQENRGHLRPYCAGQSVLESVLSHGRLLRPCGALRREKRGGGRCLRDGAANGAEKCREKRRRGQGNDRLRKCFRPGKAILR